MSRSGYSQVQKTLQLPGRDSLELASLAETDQDDEDGNNSRIRDEDDDVGSDISSPSGVSSSRRLSLDQEDPLVDSSAAAAQQTRSNNLGRNVRSYSISSAFDFTPALFPLSSTVGAGRYQPLGRAGTGGSAGGGGGGGGGHSTTDLPMSHLGGGGGGARSMHEDTLERQKTITYLNGLSLVVTMIIGSGIFSSPSEVNSHTGSPGASLIVWTIAGLLAWTGAASFAELGSAIPLNGGAQVYLSKIFGELLGFLFSWTALLVLKPGGGAIVAVILGEYTVRAIIGAEVEQINPWVNKAPAILGLALVTLLNCVSTKVTARISDLFMLFKFVALIAVTVIGIVVATTGLSYQTPANTDWKTKGWFDNTSRDIGDWALALYAGLWAFEGWDNASYVAGEYKNPARDIPLVLHTAMPMVILCYLAANISYFLVLPQNLINSSNTVAVQFGTKVFGPIGAFFLALIVGTSAFGTLNAGAFSTGRLIYVAGREGYLPAMFGQIGLGSSGDPAPSRLKRRSWFTKFVQRHLGDEGELGHTPINAIVLNFIITAIYIAVGEFKSLITFYGVAAYSFYFLTVLGLLVLRIREPLLERPYRTWITTPIIFCCVSLFLVSRAIIAQPGQTAIVVAFVASGIPVYLWRVRARDGGDGGGGGIGGVKKMSYRDERKAWQFWKRWTR